MDPPEPVPDTSEHLMLTKLDEPRSSGSSRRRCPRWARRCSASSCVTSGGALARRTEDAGALGALERRVHGLRESGCSRAPRHCRRWRRALAATREALAPVDAGTRYLNFTEHPVAPETIYEADRLERLREVKRRYDAEGLFRGNHPIN